MSARQTNSSISPRAKAGKRQGETIEPRPPPSPEQAAVVTPRKLRTSEISRRHGQLRHTSTSGLWGKGRVGAPYNPGNPYRRTFLSLKLVYRARLTRTRRLTSHLLKKKWPIGRSKEVSISVPSDPGPEKKTVLYRTGEPRRKGGSWALTLGNGPTGGERVKKRPRAPMEGKCGWMCLSGLRIAALFQLPQSAVGFLGGCGA